jgi:hypothetical protein
VTGTAAPATHPRLRAPMPRAEATTTGTPLLPPQARTPSGGGGAAGSSSSHDGLLEVVLAPPPLLPFRQRYRCRIIWGIVIVTLLTGIIVAPLLQLKLVADHEDRLPLRMCNNTLDFSVRPPGANYPTCAELINEGKYSCRHDFCPGCKLHDMCNKQCIFGDECELIYTSQNSTDYRPTVHDCSRRALGRGEYLVLLAFLGAWVSLMAPELLPLARCTSAMAGAVLVVMARKFGHDLPESIKGHESTNTDENLGWVEMDSYAQVELPIIALLAGLMILAGFVSKRPAAAAAALLRPRLPPYSSPSSSSSSSSSSAANS